jgi:ech hydrogenase subunit A
MNEIAWLILLPLAGAVVLPLLPGGMIRNTSVRLLAVAVAYLSYLFAVQNMGDGPIFFTLEGHWLEPVSLAAEVALVLFLLERCRFIIRREWWIPVLVVAQAGIMFSLELSGSIPHADHVFYFDNLSIIMALIIGFVGGLITLYSVGYMQEYHEHHPEVKPRWRVFFVTVLVFLSAMFGLVFANSLPLMFLFWEVTTVCSFILIGYTKTEEATRNAFHALGLNLLGGLGFAGAIAYLSLWSPERTVELSALLAMAPGVALLPAAGIALAGLAKAAQMPFSSWLLGAMVAPAPVSALLHSSTMVKAGVFVLVKLAPVFQMSAAGLALAAVGAVTFLTTSAMAVSQRNAKRVLAYSTIANLGLIVMCAGVGTAATVQAAILLIIFHAVAKALLFLGTGPIESATHSKDIEQMDALLVRRPDLGAPMVIGILGMFLAPFGMLISKYTCIKAFMESSPMLALVIAFGSAPTMFFWTKWLGKLLTMPRNTEPLPGRLSSDVAMALIALSLGTVAASVCFPWISLYAIEPYLAAIFTESVPMDWEAMITMVVILGLVFLLPIIEVMTPRLARQVEPYLAGVNTDESRSFKGSLGMVRQVKLINYYLGDFLNEAVLTRLALAGACLALGIMFTSVVI